MDFKSSSRYFHKSLLPLYIGIPLALLGALQIFWDVFSLGWFFENAFTVAMVAGILMVLFFFVAVTRDSEYDNNCAARLRTFKDDAIAKVMANDKYTKVMETYIAESYVYDPELVSEIKKGRDGTFRTDVYSASAIVIGAKKLFIYTVTFSLLEDKSSESFRVYTYPSVNRVYISDETTRFEKEKKVLEPQFHFFCVETATDTAKYPSHNDSFADEVIKLIDIRKEKLEAEASSKE